MTAVVTAKEMAAMDSAAINDCQIPGLILMENAGRGIAEIAFAMLGNPAGKTVHIYCGSGNNGGDGYVVTRHLLNHSATVRVFIFAAADKIKGDALTNLNILLAMGQQPEFLTRVPANPGQADLIVDAILGTGVVGPLRGLYAEVVEFINSQNVPVLAIDIPTGVNADTGQVGGPAVKATRTATMALPKRGLLFSPGREQTGRLDIVDISMPPGLVEKNHPQVYGVDASFVRALLPKRPPDAHKNRCGMVQVIAGSRGFTGAAALTSRAVLRAGAGLSYLNIPASLNNILESLSAEVITQPVDDNGAGLLALENFDAIQSALVSKSALVLGPGIGQAKTTVDLVHKILTTCDLPLVLDADGLNACASQTTLLKEYRGPLVVTPHPGELSRLCGQPAADIIVNRVEVARRYAAEWQCTLVLKGGPTCIATKDGRVYINSTGNAGMATAGSGDVLAGIIAAFIGQGLSTENAAVAGVYVHGLAGDLAAAQFGQMGMIAGDILNIIPAALLRLTEVD